SKIYNFCHKIILSLSGRNQLLYVRMYIEYILVDSNLIKKNRLPSKAWAVFLVYNVFLYNNMKPLVKTFRLLQKHNIQSSFSSSNSYNSMLSSLSLLSFPIKISMSAYFFLMFTFKLIIYSLAIQFIFNNPSKHLKFLFKSFFRLLIQNSYILL
ncbi:hypothetical protein IC3_06161, partial [Bacillus cereus VD142]